MAGRSEEASEYRAGYCNIGARERRKRYTVAAIGFVAALCYLGAVVLFRLPLALLLGLFALLCVTIEWYIQARSAFCARFALLGRYDFSGSSGETGVVDDAEDRTADRRQAFRITAASVGIAAALTAVVALGVDVLVFA